MYGPLGCFGYVRGYGSKEALLGAMLRDHIPELRHTPEIHAQGGCRVWSLDFWAFGGLGCGALRVSGSGALSGALRLNQVGILSLAPAMVSESQKAPVWS